MKTENVVQIKAFQFSVRVIKLYKYLILKKEYMLAKQILRSGTSVGANIEEAIGGCSRKDFIAKMTIAYKEAIETDYWLRLLTESTILNQNEAESITRDCTELISLLVSILKTTKSKQ